MSINAVFLSGNLTRDPELRTTPGGKQVASFSVATNEGKDKTEFHNCIAWEKTAEIVAQYCRKGNRIAVQGRLQTRKWEKDGITRYATEIVASNIDLPPKGSNSDREPNEGLAQAAQAIDELEDSIPFDRIRTLA